jgi:hypothetical protein
MLRKLALGVMILLATRASAIPPNELPFGSYDLDIFAGQSFEGQVDTLHDLLGFNIFWENDYISLSNIREFGSSGINVIRAYTPSSDSFAVYSNYNYAKIEAEECGSKVRMYGGSQNCHGGEINDSCWVANQGEDGAILFCPDGFNPPCWGWPPGDDKKYYIKMERKYPTSALPWDQGHTISYSVDIRAMIDSIGPDDPVCTLKVACQPWDGVALQDSVKRILTTNDFDDVNTWEEFRFGFTLPETLAYVKGPDTLYSTDYGATGVKIKIVSSGERTLRVDWIKIYDQTGIDLVETDLYSDKIADFVPQFADLEDTLWGWYFRDEPYFVNIPVMGAILDTARVYGNPDWRAITAVNQNQLYSYWFEQIPNMDLFTPDIYPFYHTEGEDSAKYAGYETTNNPSLKMQNRLNRYSDLCGLAYSAASNHGGEFWVMPQCFKGGGVEGANAWRKPTMAELSSQTYMALAHGAQGIIYWKYGNTPSYPLGYISGIYDTSGTRTDLWDAIVYDINPYVKAIDSTYLDLTWQRSYTYKSGLFGPPSGAFVSSISAWSHPDTSNQDMGWIHVGEFAGGSDKYVMLVNRACSRGENDPTPAPSVTATVKFDPSSLGLGNYVYIIDIADSVEYVNYDSVLFWSDTTYSAALNGTIPFTTVLGPGEGRLFKIVQASKRDLTYHDDELSSLQGR